MMNQPYSPPQKSGPSATKIILIILVFVGVPCVLLGVLVATFAKRGMEMASKTVMPLASCALNFQSARDGLLAYARDHSDTLPKAETWQDDIKSYYVKSLDKQLTQKGGEVLGVEFKLEPWKEDGPWGCRVTDTEMTGIAFNTKMAGKKISDVASDGNAVLLFEVEKSGKNLHREYVPLPADKAPRLFGETRDWLVANFSGKVDFKAGKNGSGFNFETNSSDGNRVEVKTGESK